jgi:hypothetical protein
MTQVSSIDFRQSQVPYGDRVDILDALRRFAAGQDLRDRPLLASAFAPQARLDFTQPGARLGVDLPVFEGREAIVDAVFGSTAPLDTTHTLTNERIVAYARDTATVMALIEAQHLLRDDHERRLLLKNSLTVEVSRAGDEWRISAMIFRNVWREGDPAVLFPQ